MRERKAIEAVIEKLDGLPRGDRTESTGTLLVAELLLDIRDQNEQIIELLADIVLQGC